VYIRTLDVVQNPTHSPVLRVFLADVIPLRVAQDHPGVVLSVLLHCSGIDFGTEVYGVDDPGGVYDVSVLS
jgi:hypothetical protein